MPLQRQPTIYFMVTIVKSIPFLIMKSYSSYVHNKGIQEQVQFVKKQKTERVVQQGRSKVNVNAISIIVQKLNFCLLSSQDRISLKTPLKLLKKEFIHIHIWHKHQIGQGLGRFLSCGARKQEQTQTTLFHDNLPPHWGSNPRTSVCEANALTPQQTAERVQFKKKNGGLDAVVGMQ